MAEKKKSKGPSHGESGLFRGKTERVLDEFDYDALNVLPDQGAKKNRYIDDAFTVLQLKKKLEAPDLPSNFVSMRLRDLRDRGLVVSSGGVAGSAGKHVWQRTPEGRKVAMAHLPATPVEPEAAQG